MDLRPDSKKGQRVSAAELNELKRRASQKITVSGAHVFQDSTGTHVAIRPRGEGESYEPCWLARILEVPITIVGTVRKVRVVRIDRETGDVMPSDYEAGGYWCRIYLSIEDDDEQIAVANAYPRLVVGRTNLFIHLNPDWDPSDEDSCRFECRQLFGLHRICLT